TDDGRRRRRLAGQPRGLHRGRLRPPLHRPARRLSRRPDLSRAEGGQGRRQDPAPRSRGPPHVPTRATGGVSIMTIDWPFLMPLIFAGLMGVAILVYVILDGFDLGIGI